MIFLSWLLSRGYCHGATGTTVTGVSPFRGYTPPRQLVTCWCVRTPDSDRESTKGGTYEIRQRRDQQQ
jgi:hypothetical protein